VTCRYYGQIYVRFKDEDIIKGLSTLMLNMEYILLLWSTLSSSSSLL